MKRKLGQEEEEERPNKKQKLQGSKWQGCHDQLSAWIAHQEQESEEAIDVVPRTFHNANSASSAYQDIERRVLVLRKTFHTQFDGGGTKSPSPQQRYLFDLIMTVNMRWIVGERYEMYKPLLLTELQLIEIKRDLHYIMSRQQGKTTGVQEAGATMGIHIPFKQSIFSTGGRTSKAMMKGIRAAVRRKLDGDEAESRIITENESELKIRVMPLDPVDRPLYSITCAYPASGASKFL